ncbi:MAG: hypothetical protein BM564_05630 [Bacteroidetes bacterium MedPE-SWsnd-G2]|nr:MAG: hypothetical protein BM564_05630 [Bacteroidetes bacterium MedPE-SWsnd-G2]
MKSTYFLILIYISLFACAQNNTPVNDAHSYQLIVEDLDNPWGFVFLPDGSMLINEKEGKMIHFKNGKKTEVSGLPEIYVRGQGGLMDIIIDPNYKSNGWLYFSYASAKGSGSGGNTAVMRAKLRGNALTQQQLLYKATPNTTKGQHFGSRLCFDENGYLFFSIGERGERDINPQDITRDGGKIYRINPDGSIPNSNPFINSKNAKTAIFSYGHRNPQGMSLHPETKQLWIHEHGPKGGDEINIIKEGKNYGWPKVTYGKNYSGTTITEHTTLPNMEEPLYQWTPSIAPSGMAFINSDKYGAWKGNLLVGSLKFQYLARCVMDDNQVVYQEKLLADLGRVRSVNQGPDGFIYVGIENFGIVKLILN